MKKINFYLMSLVVVAFCMFACVPEEPEVDPNGGEDNGGTVVVDPQGDEFIVIDFDDVELPSEGYDNTKSFTLNDLTFACTLEESYGYMVWNGCAVSNNVDVETAGYTNQMSVYAGYAKSGNNFMVYYKGTDYAFKADKDITFSEMSVCLNTYSALSMLNGDDFAKKFESGDWFLLTIDGFNLNDEKTGTIEFYLADYRDGNEFVCTDWNVVKMDALGKCAKVVFTFTSSDNGQWGMNTPAYVCVDDIKYLASEE